MEIYFISWTLDGNNFIQGKPLVKICRLMLTRWNKFWSSTENNNYPINNFLQFVDSVTHYPIETYLTHFGK